MPLKWRNLNLETKTCSLMLLFFWIRVQWKSSDLSQIAFMNFWDIGHVKITCYMQITFSPKNEISNYFQVEIMFREKKNLDSIHCLQPSFGFFFAICSKEIVMKRDTTVHFSSKWNSPWKHILRHHLITSKMFDYLNQ